MSRVAAAFIGVGRMGGRMCDHAVRAGHEVRVFDVDPAAVATRVAAGATAGGSAADAARGASVVGVVVFDDAQALDVVTGPSGVLQTLSPGSVIALHTTVTLGTVRALGEAAEAQGVHLLDAGISGGEEGAAAGTLLTLVGGPSGALEIARSVFDAFSKEVVHAGPLGAGMALKLARNASGYLMMAAVHEAMLLAARAGVDLGLLSHVITETGVPQQAMAPFALGGPDALPDGDTGLRPAMEHLAQLADKDLQHTMALAAELGVDLPVAEVTRRTFFRVARLAAAPGSP